MPRDRQEPASRPESKLLPREGRIDPRMESRGVGPQRDHHDAIGIVGDVEIRERAERQLPGEPAVRDWIPAPPRSARATRRLRLDLVTCHPRVRRSPPCRITP